MTEVEMQDGCRGDACKCEGQRKKEPVLIFSHAMADLRAAIGDNPRTTKEQFFLKKLKELQCAYELERVADQEKFGQMTQSYVENVSILAKTVPNDKNGHIVTPGCLMSFDGEMRYVAGVDSTGIYYLEGGSWEWDMAALGEVIEVPPMGTAKSLSLSELVADLMDAWTAEEVDGDRVGDLINQLANVVEGSNKQIETWKARLQRVQEEEVTRDGR